MHFSKSTLGFYDDPKNYKNAPDDMVEISDEIYGNVCANRPVDKILSADENGFPILVDIDPPSESDIAKRQIAEIEASITDRRLREAMLSTTGKSWLAARDSEIAELRAKIV